MIQYSFSTMFMAVFSCTVIIIFVTICFCSKKLLVTMGYKMFALLIGLTILRLAFPFQFPFAVNIILPESLSRIVVEDIRHPFYITESIKISRWQIAEIIGVAVSIVLLTVFIIVEIVFRHKIVLYGKELTHEERYSRMLSEICGDRSNPFRVIAFPGLPAPVINGFFSPRILIPEGMELDDADLRYLLAHETAHHFHHDILTKFGITLMSIAYWWNPACYLLQAQLNAILEMRIDSYVTGDINKQVAGYLNCLIHIMEYTDNRPEKKIKIPKGAIGLFSPRKKIQKFFNNLENRFCILSEEPKPYAKALHIAVIILTVALYVLSYCFIFEARYFLPESEEAVIVFSSTNVYAIINEDDTYDIYYGGVWFENISSLEDYFYDIPVYNSLDEVPKELHGYVDE